MFHQKSSDYKETIVQYNLGFSSKMGVLNEKRCKSSRVYLGFLSIPNITRNKRRSLGRSLDQMEKIFYIIYICHLKTTKKIRCRFEYCETNTKK